MSRPWDLIVGFGRFWYDFIIGDDWLAAAGVAALIAGTYGLMALGITAWWFGPLVILAAVSVTIRRALNRRADEL